MMTIMLSEVYDALVAAGVPEDKARKAAEALGGGERRFDKLESLLDKLESRLEARFVRVEGEAVLLKWMIGFVLAFQAGIFVKLFLHYAEYSAI
jgi:hypothetical protein